MRAADGRATRVSGTDCSNDTVIRYSSTTKQLLVVELSVALETQEEKESRNVTEINICNVISECHILVP